MKQCEWCYNYNKSSCPLFSFSELDRLKTRMYIVDCWCDEEDNNMCSKYGCVNIKNEDILNGI